MLASPPLKVTWFRRLGYVGITTATVIFGGSSLWLLAPNWIENRNPMMHPRMAEVAWRWGQFAPLPPSAKQFRIATSGSSLSRTFSGSFAAESAVLEQWLQNSPSLNFDEGVQLDSGHIRYTIDTKQGVGSVELDPANSVVYFEVSWS